MTNVQETARGNLSPREGGCWFCHKAFGEMDFTMEWDSYYHKDCLRHALKEGNPEAEIIANEYNLFTIEQDDKQNESTL